MEEERKQDLALNLSNSRKETEGTAMLNGESNLNGDINHDTVQAHSPSSISSAKGPPALVGAARRKSKPVSDSTTNTSALSLAQAVQTPVLMMAAQHGLLPQQLQQLLQQQAPGADLQLVMQQSMILQHQQQQQKLQEGVLHQLNEQLQLNFIQLSQLVQQQQQQQNDKKASKQTQQQMQQLGIQQQQILQQIQQIQLQQRQYLMACLGPQLGGLHQGMMSPGEIQQLWKEVAGQTGLDENVVKNNLNGMSLPTSLSNCTIPQSPIVHNPGFLNNGSLPVDGFLLSGGGLIGQPPISIKHNDTPKSASTPTPDVANNSTTNPPPSNPLCRHNFCKWPGCDTHFEDYAAFIKHLNSEHVLDDRSTAQARVQLQVVNQLEMQLTREKELLQGMMQHLHMKPPPVSSQLSPLGHAPSHAPTPKTPQHHHGILTPTEPKPRSPLNQPMMSNHVSLPQLTAALPVSVPSLPLPSPTMTLTIPTTPTSQLSQSMSQPHTPNSAGPIRRRVSDKCNLPISAGISNEIQRNREFYKNTDVRPPFTYASLIRQSIIESPHRQLTLNEVYQWFQNTFAYFRRNEATWKNAVRHNLSLHKCFMRVENVKGAVWTVDEIEFYRRRPQKMSGNMKSPSYSDPVSFNESLNASLRAALGESSLSLLGSNNIGQDSAEDLSMKSNSNGHDDLYRDEELMMHAIKQEEDDDDLDQSEYMETEVEREIDQSQERDGTFDQSEEREDFDRVEKNCQDLSVSRTKSNGMLGLVADNNILNKTVNQPEITSRDEDEDGVNPADEMVEDMGCFSIPRVSQEVSLTVTPSASAVV